MRKRHRGMYALLAVSAAQSAGCGFLFTSTNVHQQPPAQIIVTGQQMGEQ